MGSTDPNFTATDGPAPSTFTPLTHDHAGRPIEGRPSMAPAPAAHSAAPEGSWQRQIPTSESPIDRIFHAGFSPSLSYNDERIGDMSPSRAKQVMDELLGDGWLADPTHEQYPLAQKVFHALSLRAAGGQPRGTVGEPTAPPPGVLSPAEQHATTLTPDQQRWAAHWASPADNAAAFQGTHLDAEALAMFDPAAVAVVRVAAARTGAPADAVAEVLATALDLEQGHTRPAKDLGELYQALTRAMGRDGRQVVNQTEDVLERVMRIEPGLRARVEALFQADDRARARAMSPDVVRAIWQVGQRLGWVR
jgi:hypothetical protein